MFVDIQSQAQGSRKFKNVKKCMLCGRSMTSEYARPELCEYCEEAKRRAERMKETEKAREVGGVVKRSGLKSRALVASAGSNPVPRRKVKNGRRKKM
jgi:hypothetical protein